jgi:hypothetical protein
MSDDKIVIMKVHCDIVKQKSVCNFMNVVFPGKWICCEGIYAMVPSLIRKNLGYVPSMPTPLRVDSSSLGQ